MDAVINAILYGVGAVFASLAFYTLYLVIQAENNKNTCPNPECHSCIKYCKLHIYGDVWVCEACHHGLIITPVAAKRVSDTALLHAVRQRLDDANERDRLGIDTTNYLNWLAGLVETRVQSSTEEEQLT